MESNINKEVEKRLVELFNTISIDEMAKNLRQSNYILALTFIRKDDNENPIEAKKADDCFYWLNELAEALEPVLNR